MHSRNDWGSFAFSSPSSEFPSSELPRRAQLRVLQLRVAQLRVAQFRVAQLRVPCVRGCAGCGLVGPETPPHSSKRARSVHCVHGSKVPPPASHHGQGRVPEPGRARTPSHIICGEETPRCTAALPPTDSGRGAAPGARRGAPLGFWNPAELDAGPAVRPV
jgi:hypothetical protein